MGAQRNEGRLVPSAPKQSGALLLSSIYAIQKVHFLPGNFLRRCSKGKTYEQNAV
jgi:hypothetical protein